jgi:hypothetical protein
MLDNVQGIKTVICLHQEHSGMKNILITWAGDYTPFSTKTEIKKY